MTIATRITASLVLLLTAAMTGSPATAAVWDDDAGLVFFGNGYAEPTAYEDAFNALEGRTLSQIAGTSSHVCAIDGQGEAVCWGEPDRGRHGTGARRFPPGGPAAVDTSGVLDGKTLVDIDAGLMFTCALDDTGQAYCWGNGREGQLGRPNVYRAFTPVKVFQRMLPDGVGFVDITTGAAHACGLTDEGHAYCWGDGSHGQLGTQGTRDQQSPSRVKPGDIDDHHLVTIDAGDLHTCATDAAGRAYCWGDGSHGRLGTGDGHDRSAPTKVVGSGPNGHSFAEVGAGGTHTCATTQARRLFCWGSNKFHQVSPSDHSSVAEPRRVDVGQVSDFSVGHWHTCAVVEATDIYCWGYNRDGQIGDGTKDLAKRPTPIKSPGDGLNGTEPELVQALSDMTCALDAAGDAYCWGDHGTWMAGNVLRPALTPRRVAHKPTGLDGETLTDITDSGYGWCALSSPSQPVCYSYGTFGFLSFYSRGFFRDIDTTGTFDGDPVHSLDTGTAIACALSDVGAAYCWGTGPLGVEGTYRSATPVAVDTSGALAGRTLVDVSVDEAHACAIDDTGKAFCWGEDTFGELGNGAQGSSDVPVEVKDSGVLAGEVLVAIETSQFNTCALSDNGDVFCWGTSPGEGNGTPSQKPVRTDLSLITPGETVMSLHAAYETPCLLTDAGHAYCWGSSYQGQTGTGYLTYRRLPTPVVRDGVLTGVQLSDLAMPSNTAMCGLSTAGRIYCWGDDQYGVLGNGDFDGSSSVPVSVVRTGVLEGAVVTELGAGAGSVWALTAEAP